MPTPSQFLLLLGTLAQLCTASQGTEDPSDVGVLQDLQVYPPVLTPTSDTSGKNEYGCVVTKTLMDHDFANSYGQPFIGDYTPPDCSFNRVVINFTLTTAGRQYDRLAIMYLNSTEVWRTSTAEPTADGIVYSYAKEMQQYLPLWKEPQNLIFDLANIVDSTYTGVLNTTLTATFFTVPETPAAADAILPISLRLGSENKSSVAYLPSDELAVSYTLPRNLKRAVISVSACGQGDEEFWYQNVFSSDVDTFKSISGELYGYGPWREIQVWIDDMLAGISWPFPIIFTGGIVPGFWRPIVGIDAFDLREHEIDITPFIPYLSDGKPHSFRITAAGVNDHRGLSATVSNTTTDFWYVTGKLFLFHDEDAQHVTTGTLPAIVAPEPLLRISRHILTNSTGSNETLTESTIAQRSLHISSTIRTSSGEQEVSWSQQVSYVNYNQLSDYGWYQSTVQNTIGVDKTGDSIGYTNAYEYPINCNYTWFETSTELGLFGNLSRSLSFNVTGPSIFPNGPQPLQLASAGNEKLPSELFSLNTAGSGSILNTWQIGTASYYNNESSTTTLPLTFGSTNQTMEFQAVGQGAGEIYTRSVGAVNYTITHDETNFRLGDIS